MPDECQITLIAPVTHDRENYGVGEVLILARSQAERLVRLGCGVFMQDASVPRVVTVAADTQKLGTVVTSVNTESTKGHDDALLQAEGLIESVLDKIDPKDMTVEELESELTAAGIEVREGASKKALEAQVNKLRKDGE